MSENASQSFATYWATCLDASCLLDASGMILETNSAFDAMVGEPRGSTLWLHISDERRGQLESFLRKTGKTEDAISFTSDAPMRANGSSKWTWRLWRTQSTEAHVIAMVTNGEDARTQAMVGDEMKRAHQIIDTSPTFVVAINAAGNTVFMNGTMLRAVGFERHEVIGRSYSEMFVPEREHALLGQIFQYLSASKTHTLNENHVKTRNGKEILVEWHGRAIFNDQGQLQFFYGVGIDVTEQRRTQNELLNSQQRLALHFKQSPLGMIEWDREFRVMDWNPAAERIFGYSREEALGKYGQDLVVPIPVRPYVADVWQQLLASRGAVNAHNENITKDGRTIVCEWSNTTLIDANGEVIGVASLVNDVTDRKKAEEDLREKERIQAATIEQLSVPIIDIWDGILALPIVGSIDEARAMRMTEALLEAIVRTGTRFAILDLTGATAVDATIANHLGAMIRATRLVGSECFVSGLGPGIARKLVEFDIALSVRTFGSLRAALRQAIRQARV